MSGRTAVLAVLLVALSSRHGTHAQVRARGERWECSLDDAQLPLVCAPAPTSGESRYITDVLIQSTDHLADQLRLVAGTQGAQACSVNPLSLTIGTVGQGGNPRLIANPALVGGDGPQPPTHLRLRTPLRVPKGLDFCVFPEQTLTIHVLGYLAP